MEPIPATVATWTLLISRPTLRQKGRGFIPNRLPVIDAIKRKGQNIMQVPTSSMIFNVRTAIKISMR
jgi:hypothetical protein